MATEILIPVTMGFSDGDKKNSEPYITQDETKKAVRVEALLAGDVLQSAMSYCVKNLYFLHNSRMSYF